MKIAIQGGTASFHDMATQQIFGEQQFNLVHCRTFLQQSRCLASGAADCAVMAIENSLAGGILPNYSLLQRFCFTIVGEHYLKVKQNLMALPGQALQDIHTIRSHPMALHQCSNFLEELRQVRSEESHDTAESARDIAQNQRMGVAAIASELASEHYRLPILAAGIENEENNYTRFLVLATANFEQPAEPNKASMNFRVRHQAGALADILDIFREAEINLVLIQSLPVHGVPHEYALHVDVEWRNRRKYDDAMARVQKTALSLTVLGEYCAAQRPL